MFLRFYYNNMCYRLFIYNSFGFIVILVAFYKRVTDKKDYLCKDI